DANNFESRFLIERPSEVAHHIVVSPLISKIRLDANSVLLQTTPSELPIRYFVSVIINIHCLSPLVHLFLLLRIGLKEFLFIFISSVDSYLIPRSNFFEQFWGERMESHIDWIR
ncbi:hypothetical protein PFISCL1PPCAC_1222, partial [Pristionchus fissidentatus]